MAMAKFKKKIIQEYTEYYLVVALKRHCIKETACSLYRI